MDNGGLTQADEEFYRAERELSLERQLGDAKAENERLRGILQALIATIKIQDSQDVPPSIVCGADLAELALEEATDETPTA